MDRSRNVEEREERSRNSLVTESSLYPLSESVTIIPKTKFTHRWNIRNFTLIPSNLEYISSPPFTCPSTNDKWYMRLRPKWKDEATGLEYISCHLFLERCGEAGKDSRRATYSVTVTDAEGEKRFSCQCSKREGRQFTARREGHGYLEFAPREDILSAAQNILGTDDTLRIICEITAIGDMVSELLPLKRKVDNLYSAAEMKERSLSEDFRALLFAEKELGDVIIETKDGIRMKARQLLLKARSNVFRAMLEHDTKEKVERKIVISDFETPVIEKMLYFIYTDELDAGDGELVGDLLLLADKYDLPMLKKLCEQHLTEKEIKVDNAGYLLTLADSCNCPKMKRRVMEFICANSANVCESCEWELQLGNRSHLYKETFENLAFRQRRQN